MNAPLLAQPLSVVLLASDPIARASLARVIAHHADLRLETQAAHARQLDWNDVDATCVLWDLGHADGEATAPALSDDLPPDAEVLALAADAEVAVHALSAGAVGVLRRGGDPDRIAPALHAMAVGLRVFDDAFATRLLASAPHPSSGAEPMTPRELEVLELLAEGLGNRAIGRRLGISEHTAKFHIGAILWKLEADTRTAAVVRAIRQGILHV